jgi:hypothetical protein
VVGATAGLVLSVVAAPAAGADPIGNCSTTTGVIVAVDFSSWGGDIERGCDARITNGYHALHAAGFTTAGDTQDGPGFICRIDDRPSPAEDACVTTPPADASWSYWHADVGHDTWTYSQLGAMGYQPPPGSVDAWTFGSTDIGPDGQPTFPPSSVRATNGSGTTTTTEATTSTVPTTTAPIGTDSPGSPGPSTAGTGDATSGAGTSPPTTGAGTTAGRRPVSSAPGTEPTTTATTSGGEGPVRSGAGRALPKIVDAAPVAGDRQADGSPVPLVVGAGVVVALAGAAAAVAWRRRRTS